MTMSDPEQPDRDLARQLGNLWPHRKHASPALTFLLCGCGMHYWRALALGDLYPGKAIHYCFWCSKVRIDRIVSDV